MHPVDFEGSNTKLTKPIGWTDEECSEMPALKSCTPEGIPFFLTAWRPNKEDLDALNRGGPLILVQYGEGFVPTSLYTLDERGNANI